MYYEEKVIDGVLCCRHRPNDEFVPVRFGELRREVLTRLVVDRSGEHPIPRMERLEVWVRWPQKRQDKERGKTVWCIEEPEKD